MTSLDYGLEDQLSSLEPPYKSKGEAQVGRLLDRYGIPFHYEQPLVVYSRRKYRIWHPDFTLPTYDNLIIEYAGMPDRQDYMDGIKYKEKIFKENSIPAMIVYPSNLNGPDWPATLYEKIQEESHKYSKGKKLNIPSAK